MQTTNITSAVHNNIMHDSLHTVYKYLLCTMSHNRASTVNTTIYPKGYAQSKCVYSNDARW